MAVISMPMATTTEMTTEQRSINHDPGLMRLFQLISPSLPIGAYSYSQGIEWAVEQGWIRTGQDLSAWLQGLLETSVLYLELPVFLRMYEAWKNQDQTSVSEWNDYLLASRETYELRQEEVNRARAFSQLLISLDQDAAKYKPILAQSQLACFSYACISWDIERQASCYGLVWGWLENLVLSAVKIIPLGQTAGQQVLYSLGEQIPQIIQRARQIETDDIGASSMALAIASSMHETQYTRLFRS